MEEPSEATSIGSTSCASNERAPGDRLARFLSKPSVERWVASLACQWATRKKGEAGRRLEAERGDFHSCRAILFADRGAAARAMGAASVNNAVVTVLSLVATGLACCPDPVAKKLQLTSGVSDMWTLTTLLRFLHLISFATAFGTALWVTFIGGIIMFKYESEPLCHELCVCLCNCRLANLKQVLTGEDENSAFGLSLPCNYTFLRERERVYCGLAIEKNVQLMRLGFFPNSEVWRGWKENLNTVV